MTGVSFKRDIIIVNQFSVKRGQTGTKGNTPGDFVLRYMARDNATETLTPIKKLDIDNFITRYMARDDATEQANSLHDLGHKFYKAQGLGGRSFGKVGAQDVGSVSLSDSEIRNASGVIQDAFDNGHTVLESVISFDGNYLKRHGLVDPKIPLDSNGHATVRGAFRGKLDQMKLRMAIMHGLNQMANRRINKHQHRFDSLAYVGVIQVDTQQVHCHLAMCDLGKGVTTVTHNRREQKGVLTKKDREFLRRGIDNSLDRYSVFKRLSIEVARERQNTKSYVKRYTEKAMQHSSLATIVLAALPKDKTKWRARSTSEEMRQANSIMSFYVDRVLQKPKSGYQKAVDKVTDYARARQKRENLNDNDYRRLLGNGRDNIKYKCMDSVYDLLKKVPEKDKTVSTKVLDGLTADLDKLREAESNIPKEPEIEFTYHLKAYTGRLKESRVRTRQYNELAHDYEKAKQNNNVTPDSKVVQDFYKEERDYYNKLTCKYQTLMPLMARRNTYQKYLKRMREFRKRLEKMRQMQLDSNFKHMRGRSAEQYGEKMYGIRGGSVLANSSYRYGRIVDQNTLIYEQMQDTAKIVLTENNKSLSYDKNGDAVSQNKLPYKFKDVRYYDLHKAINDDDNVKLSQGMIKRFNKLAQNRKAMYLKAADYAMRTNQPELLRLMDDTDIKAMADTADRLMQNNQPEPKKRNSNNNVELPKKKTVSLDNNLTDQMQKQIINTINTLEIDNGAENEADQNIY